jgi:hypothetical protein
MLITLAILTSLMAIVVMSYHVVKVIDTYEQSTVEALTEGFETDITIDLQYGRVDEKQVREDLSPRY